MGCGAVVWDSRKQRTVALSTTEAEYIALSDATKEALHLRRFLLELRKRKLKIDNLSTQKLAMNPVYQARTKHIDVKHHFVREVMESKEVNLEHMASEDMPADILTKPLSKLKHERSVKS